MWPEGSFQAGVQGRRERTQQSFWDGVGVDIWIKMVPEPPEPWRCREKEKEGGRKGWREGGKRGEEEKKEELGMATYTYNSSKWEAEVGRLL